MTSQEERLSSSPDTYGILTKAYACGHEVFVPYPKAKFPTSDDTVRFSFKCENCDFPRLLSKFRSFNNPHNKFDIRKATLLAYDMFDSRQCLSVENIDALMRHFMRGLQFQLFEESKQKALFDGLAETIGEQDGPLAGKEMRALLESGYIRFTKKGRIYTRPISRMRSRIKTAKMNLLSRPGSPASSERSLSPTPAFRSSAAQFGASHASSPLSRGPINPNELQTSDDEEDLDEEEKSRLRLAMERLHAVMEQMGSTKVWGNPGAEADVINDYCDDMKGEAEIAARKEGKVAEDKKRL